MECFGPMDLKNCCVNTTVEQYYKWENGSDNNAYYYLNNFHTLAGKHSPFTVMCICKLRIFLIRLGVLFLFYF